MTASHQHSCVVLRLLRVSCLKLGLFLQGLPFHGKPSLLRSGAVSVSRFAYSPRSSAPPHQLARECAAAGEEKDLRSGVTEDTRKSSLRGKTEKQGSQFQGEMEKK